MSVTINVMYIPFEWDREPLGAGCHRYIKPVIGVRPFHTVGERCCATPIARRNASLDKQRHEITPHQSYTGG